MPPRPAGDLYLYLLLDRLELLEPLPPHSQDPWATSDQSKASTPRGPLQQPLLPPSTTFPLPRCPPQQAPSPQNITINAGAQQPTPPQSDNQKHGWYNQTFKCRWCGAEATYSGHGHWPFEQAQVDGWNKPRSGSWAGKSSCKDCTTKYYARTPPLHHALPYPGLPTTGQLYRMALGTRTCPGDRGPPLPQALG